MVVERLINTSLQFGNGLGFNVVNGCCITTLEPMTDEEDIKPT